MVDNCGSARKVAILGNLRYTPHNPVMEKINPCILGQDEQRKIAEALRLAASQLPAAEPEPVLLTTGHIKGVCRFKTHEEMNRHDDEARARALHTALSNERD